MPSAVLLHSIRMNVGDRLRLFLFFRSQEVLSRTPTNLKNAYEACFGSVHVAS